MHRHSSLISEISDFTCRCAQAWDLDPDPWMWRVFNDLIASNQSSFGCQLDLLCICFQVQFVYSWCESALHGLCLFMPARRNVNAATYCVLQHLFQSCTVKHCAGIQCHKRKCCPEADNKIYISLSRFQFEDKSRWEASFYCQEAWKHGN